MSGSCMSRAAALVGIHVRMPFQHYDQDANLTRAEEESDHLLSHEILDLSINKYMPESESSNRVMVVVDSSHETQGALEWLLSHTAQNRGMIILLHVANATKDREMDQRVYHLLQATKNMCQLRRPEVHVDIIIRQGKEKGAVIVEAAEQLRVSLLILGRRNEPFWHLWIWMRKATQSNVVDYCFQNANCMTVAVRKSKKCGGYLITTKHHKNFWLLA
ncbi:uncharacterized protein LOC125205334 [Salvia hispanica]|uniref:uncharacterized protein LOC125198118 n=1 Tax=Salvia hispanica TaxID=49212 RepID=UPI002009755B|nr:uncharacterized protein LOC125198118 [Salvia hispanica]XP_047960161.1 uncharacterized protein LOC125205334 [Salvia hispanica]